MRNSVRRRLNVTGNYYDWRSFTKGGKTFQKDGYEIYFFNQHDGFELTIRNPETKEREIIIEVRDDDVSTASPLYVAILEHILSNVETVVTEVKE